MSQFLFNIAVSTKQLLFVNVQSFLELFEISNYEQILCTDDNVLFSADLEYRLFCSSPQDFYCLLKEMYPFAKTIFSIDLCLGIGFPIFKYFLYCPKELLYIFPFC